MRRLIIFLNLAIVFPLCLSGEETESPHEKQVPTDRDFLVAAKIAFDFRSAGMRHGLADALERYGFEKGLPVDLGNPLVWKVFFAGASLVPLQVSEGEVWSAYFNPFCDGILLVHLVVDDSGVRLDQFSAISAVALMERRETRLSDTPRYLSNPKRTPAALFPEHLSIDAKALTEVLSRLSGSDQKSGNQSPDLVSVSESGLRYLYDWTSWGFSQAMLMQDSEKNPEIRGLILRFQEGLLDREVFEKTAGKARGIKHEDLAAFPGEFLSKLYPAFALVKEKGVVIVFINSEQPIYYLSIELNFEERENPFITFVQVGSFAEVE